MYICIVSTVHNHAVTDSLCIHADTVMLLLGYSAMHAKTTGAVAAETRGTGRLGCYDMGSSVSGRFTVSNSQGVQRGLRTPQVFGLGKGV